MTSVSPRATRPTCDPRQTSRCPGRRSATSIDERGPRRTGSLGRQGTSMHVCRATRHSALHTLSPVPGNRMTERPRSELVYNALDAIRLLRSLRRRSLHERQVPSVHRAHRPFAHEARSAHRRDRRQAVEQEDAVTEPAHACTWQCDDGCMMDVCRCGHRREWHFNGRTHSSVGKQRCWKLAEHGKPETRCKCRNFRKP